MKSVSSRTLAGSVLAGVLLISLAACDKGSPLSNASKEASPAAQRSSVAEDSLRLSVLREAALKYGLVRPREMEVVGVSAQQEVGGLLFASPRLSFNGAISCQDCHLDRFGSGDGLPNAVGVGGVGHGLARMHSGGRILPRNVRPLWGVGGKGFASFFSDGRIELVDGKVVSQFGDKAPSNDPMVVAVHLPPAEIREMIVDTPNIRDEIAKEDVGTAADIYAEIARRVRSDPKLGGALAKAYGKPTEAISFDDISDALAQFIRHKFRVRPTRFHKFVFDGGSLTQSELNGGIIFYGRGRCVACHNGAYFSDFHYHAIAFPQAGFGKNGFGIDEGHYNVTLDPKDRFLFRTPPLFNLSKTAPYSHSGSVMTIEQAIIAHFDPLRLADPAKMSIRARADFFQRLGVAAQETLPSALDDQEVGDLKQFLATLEFSEK
ncbi:MAG: His-Xaa-Ser system-associated MauG-like protein [Novosphingobium sp.]